MKKILSTLFVLIAFTLWAGGVQAGTSGATTDLGIDIAAGTIVDVDVDAQPSGPYVLGLEWLAGQTTNTELDLGSSTLTPGAALSDRSNILYKPAVSIGIGNTMTLTMTGGAIKVNSGKYYLWLIPNPAAVYVLPDVAPLPMICASMIDYTVDANGNYATMRFQFLETYGQSGGNDPSMRVGDIAVMVRTPATPVGTVGSTTSNKPIFVVKSAGLAANGGVMTIGVTSAFDNSGQPLSAPLAAPEIVVKTATQMSAVVQNLNGGTYAVGPATSTIDVEQNRTKFVSEGTGSDTPTTTTSTFAVLVNPTSATVNYGINPAAANYTMTVVGDQAAISGVALEGIAFTRGTNQWTLASTSFAAPHDLRIPSQNDITITVNGTGTIDVATYYVTLVITPATGDTTSPVTVLNQATAAVWAVNAMQVRIPYLVVDTRTTGNSGYASFFEMTNRTNLPVNVTIDAIVSNEDGTTNLATETKTNAIILPAHSVTIIRQADLDTWFVNIGNTRLYRVALVLTADAPQNGVDVTAWHIGPTTRTSAAVLYNTNNLYDGRKWQ